MRPALRLLASVQRSTRFLEPGEPTGLTGLFNHPSPRSTLLYLYYSTLEKLKQFPEHSVYRQSVEALTRHRMSIVEQTKPAGLKEWQERIIPIMEEYPDGFRKVELITQPGKGEFNIIWKAMESQTEESKREAARPFPEGIRTIEERAHQAELTSGFVDEELLMPKIEGEPPLTAEQITEIETKIGAGLIEEVIEVAEGESKLADTLLESRPWEDLEEKPREGQWSYHERDAHAKGTQSPPS